MLAAASFLLQRDTHKDGSKLALALASRPGGGEADDETKGRRLRRNREEEGKRMDTPQRHTHTSSPTPS